MDFKVIDSDHLQNYLFIVNKKLHCELDKDIKEFITLNRTDVARKNEIMFKLTKIAKEIYKIEDYEVFCIDENLTIIADNVGMITASVCENNVVLSALTNAKGSYEEKKRLMEILINFISNKAIKNIKNIPIIIPKSEIDETFKAVAVDFGFFEDIGEDENFGEVEVYMYIANENTETSFSSELDEIFDSIDAASLEDLIGLKKQVEMLKELLELKRQ